jgi:hypothetical protein
MEKGAGRNQRLFFAFKSSFSGDDAATDFACWPLFLCERQS